MGFDWGSLAAAFGGVGTVLNDMNKRDDEARLKKELAEQEEARQMALEQMREESQTRRDDRLEQLALQRDQTIRDRNAEDTRKAEQESARAIAEAKDSARQSNLSDQAGLINSALEDAKARGVDISGAQAAYGDYLKNEAIKPDLTAPDKGDIADALFAQGKYNLAKPFYERDDAEGSADRAERQVENQERSTNAAIEHQQETLKLERARLAESQATGAITRKEAEQKLAQMTEQNNALSVLSKAYAPGSTASEKDKRAATDYYLATLGKSASTHEAQQQLSSLINSTEKVINDTEISPEEKTQAKELRSVLMQKAKLMFGGKATDEATQGAGSAVDSSVLRQALATGINPRTGQKFTQSQLAEIQNELNRRK